ncbi:CoB--CoM heterodisulfide reductase iron-sulfur subunit A family protein [Thermosulfurimonas sp. F29]|uniref:CoB--CoM heterodisulfide reductase iron-sulfur subunit A family protein n=1 Tax=Thermosulfurimonas sp. F29 TaxID=2867247 RepID=UPI001C83FDC6|nr:4Fe-4S binding protein [Thermosulfurimonas sp. F29]MBX6422304.1 4Fe-4S binding protein [Thermosulfurimonas sp. F29]
MRPEEKKKAGVFICECGGNISDYVEVARVASRMEKEEGVRVCRVYPFVCSEGAQEDIIRHIKEAGLEAVVIASCSPRLHQETFRRMVRRAGLNPYRYIQVNLREQCAWVHPHQKEAATEKAERLVRAGLSRALRSRDLFPPEVEVYPEAVVLGAGPGASAAVEALKTLGLTVRWLDDETEILSREGRPGDYLLRIKRGEKTEEIRAGAVLVATGILPYRPQPGEFGYGEEGVITLEEYRRLMEESPSGELRYRGRRVERVAFIYCVGSLIGENPSGECGRFCCVDTLRTGFHSLERFGIRDQFHLHLDLRAYGRYEELYRSLREKGVLFVRFPLKRVPEIRPGRRPAVRVWDTYLAEELELEVDLVVLVCGARGRGGAIGEALKLPVDEQGFFTEVHPKLRPVETLAPGIYLAGCASGPRTEEESVTVALAASAKAAALFLKGKMELEARVVEVMAERCDGCGKCVEVCPFGALRLTPEGLLVEESLCKGEGACVPVCPKKALQIAGYEHDTMEETIRRLAGEVVGGEASEGSSAGNPDS